MRNLTLLWAPYAAGGLRDDSPLPRLLSFIVICPERRSPCDESGRRRPIFMIMYGTEIEEHSCREYYGEGVYEAVEKEVNDVEIIGLFQPCNSTHYVDIENKIS